jgi:hypothetical protein
MTSTPNVYSYLSFVAPAVIMFIAAYWRRKLIFWAGALASVGLTHWLMLAAERTRALARFESITTSDGARAFIQRDMPLVDLLGPVGAIVLTLVWGAIAWYLWPRFRRRPPQQA